MYTQKFRRVRTSVVDLMPLSWPKRLLIATTGIALIGLSTLFFMLFLPLLAVGAGVLVFQILANAKRSAYSKQDFIEGEYHLENSDENTVRDHERGKP